MKTSKKVHIDKKHFEILKDTYGSHRDAATVLGVSLSTYYLWMQEEKAPKPSANFIRLAVGESPRGMRKVRRKKK